MRIAYLLELREGIGAGAVTKVGLQTAQWRALGHEVRVFVRAQDRATPEAQDLLRLAEAIADVEVHAFGSVWENLRVQWSTARSVARWRADCVYERFTAWSPAVALLAVRRPIVLEVNSDDRREYVAARRAFRLYHRLTRALYLRQADGLVCVSSELVDRVSGGRHEHPVLVLANGMDDWPEPAQRSGDGGSAEPPNTRLVVLVSNRAPWHGLDDVEALARITPEWRFDVIGVDRPPGEERANVRYWGPLPASRYRALLDAADVGIGTLRLHQKGMTEASPLKVREYLAAGLPVVTAYADTDFPAGADFLLRLPAADGAIVKHQADVAEFIECWRGRRVPPEALAHLRHPEKERRRLAFLETVQSA